MDKKTYYKLMDYMIKGKSFRMKSSVREILKSKVYFGDTWFTIIAIHFDGQLDMCGNFHTIFNNYDMNDFVIE
jgi:hypothetical protein